MDGAEAREVLDFYLDVLKNGKEFCDVTFVVGSNKEKIRCHKIFLVARSPVFKTMFTERWATGDDIELPDVEPHVFQMFLQYLYAGKTSMDENAMNVSDIHKLIYLVDKYDVSSLMKKFKKMLDSRFSTQTILEIHTVVDRFNIPGLRYRAARFMIRKFRELMLDPSFESIDAKLLEMCVIERNRCVAEIDVFKGLMKWSEARCREAVIKISGQNKRKMLGEIFKHIQFARIPVPDFEEIVAPSNILTEKDKLIVSKDRASRGKVGRSPTLNSGAQSQWTRGRVRNTDKSARRRSALLRHYYDSLPKNVKRRWDERYL